MSNTESPLNGQAETLDLMVGPDGTAYLKAAGDSLGVPTGNSDPSAPHLVQLAKAGTATHTNVTGANASTLLLAAAPTRKHVTIWNNSTAILYLKYGTGASATSCFVKLPADAYWEMPVIWTGVVYGFWDAVNGAARILELT